MRITKSIRKFEYEFGSGRISGGTDRQSKRYVRGCGTDDHGEMNHLYTVLIQTGILFYPLYSICLILKTG